jgi:hypothetical protein
MLLSPRLSLRVKTAARAARVRQKVRIIVGVHPVLADLDAEQRSVRRHELRLELGERRGRIAYSLRRGGERVALRHEDHGELHLRRFREIGDAGRGARNDRGKDSTDGSCRRRWRLIGGPRWQPSSTNSARVLT